MDLFLFLNMVFYIYIYYQIEPGSQTEQAPPSAVLWLSPEDMHGFRFLTVSVAPRPVLLAILAHFFSFSMSGFCINSLYFSFKVLFL